MRQMTQDAFLNDVNSHAMEVLRDDGVYRHLVFRKPENSWHYRFEIVTWPGVLCFRGDVGTYVFSRTSDMFDFFRNPVQDGKIYINDGYWSEKLIASDCSGRRGDGVMRFDPDLFSEEVKRRYIEHVRANMRGMPDKRQSLRRALEDEVLAYADDGEAGALQAAGSFEHEGFALTDFWEVEVRAYTVQFIWSLYAISWAIQQYDNRAALPKSDAA
jgi:hypothetical protein